MPTTVTKSIGSAGRNYPDLAAWAAALPADLTAGSGNDTVQVGQCYNDSDSFVSATNLLTLSGHTTDVTHTITLTTGTGQSFRDNPNAQTNELRYNQSNGVGIRMTGGFDVAIIVSDSNTFISNLQITGTPAQSGSRAFVNSGSAVVVIDDCILEGSGTNLVSIQNSGTKLRNSLVVQRSASAGSIARVQDGAAAYGCTFAVPSDVAAATNGINIAYTGSVLENCAIFGATNALSTTTGVTVTTSMTDATGSTGLTGGKTYANQFQNTADATRDYRTKSGADLLDAGTTDATNGTPDIVGTARPQGSAYDIGPWELVAAAPPSSSGAMGVLIVG